VGFRWVDLANPKMEGVKLEQHYRDTLRKLGELGGMLGLIFSGGRWRVFNYDEIAARDKCSLDIFWLKDESLEDSSKLPAPHILAAEVAEDLRSALEQIESVLGDLQQRAAV
jgi:hypothetical protein